MERERTPRGEDQARDRRGGGGSAEVSLVDPIECRFEITDGDRVNRVSLRVRVEFPDEVRSLLETISWRGGTSLISCLTCVGRRYVEQVRSVVLRQSSATDGDEVVVRPLFVEVRAICIELFPQGLQPGCTECQNGDDLQRRSGQADKRS